MDVGLPSMTSCSPGFCQWLFEGVGAGFVEKRRPAALRSAESGAATSPVPGRPVRIGSRLASRVERCRRRIQTAAIGNST